MDETETQSVSADQTYYDVATSRLDEQMERIDGLDTKAATAFGFSAAILPIFGALLALSKKDRPDSAIALYVAAICVYPVMLWFAHRAYKVGKWSIRPDLDTLKTYCETRSDATMRVWVANECVLSIEKNEPKLHTKAFRVEKTLQLLAADVLLLTLAALVTIA